MSHRILQSLDKIHEASPHVKLLICEWIGTFFLTLGATLISQTIPSDLAPIAMGALVLSLVYAFGFISKAQYNPAVSVGFALMGEFSFHQATGFIITQVAAASFASLVGWCLGPIKITLGTQGSVSSNNTVVNMLPAPMPNGTIAQALTVEVMLTFFLVLLVFNIAISVQRVNDFFGLVIGMYVMAASFMGGAVSGACMNPAVMFGMHAARCLHGHCAGFVRYVIPYALAQFLGSFLAVLVYRLLQPTPVQIAMNVVEKGKSDGGGEAAATREEEGLQDVSLPPVPPGSVPSSPQLQFGVTPPYGFVPSASMVGENSNATLTHRPTNSSFSRCGTTLRVENSHAPPRAIRSIELHPTNCCDA